jgi:hypothetical protein
MQIFIVLPFFIWACFKCGKWKAALIFFSFIAAVGLNAYVITSGEYTAGILSPYNYTVYSGFINKPYTKLYAVILGVGLGFLFDAKQRSKSVPI